MFLHSNQLTQLLQTIIIVQICYLNYVFFILLKSVGSHLKDNRISYSFIKAIPRLMSYKTSDLYDLFVQQYGITAHSRFATSHLATRIKSFCYTHKVVSLHARSHFATRTLLKVLINECLMLY